MNDGERKKPEVEAEPGEKDPLTTSKQPSTSSVALKVFIIVVISIAATIGLVLHFTLSKAPTPIKRVHAVGNCLPQDENNESVCVKRGCIWAPTSDGSPFCTFPANYGYTLAPGSEFDQQCDGRQSLDTSYPISFPLQRIDHPELYSTKIEQIVLHLEFQSNYRLRIKITDADDTRYTVPVEAVNMTANQIEPPDESILYNVSCTNEQRFGLKVIRVATGSVVFDTTTPGFVFSDQYIQLTVALASDNLYGLGEHNHRQFKHNMDWKKWTIFTRDEAPVDAWNLYGAQPMYMNLEENGKANAVFLLNSNAMDVVLQPEPFPAITYHVIGGILDFYVFLGPTPENIVQQYTEATGRPILPPYWSLGFQLSRWDYNNLTHVKDVVNRTRIAGIPQDVQYGDVDYMESYLDFTYDRNAYEGLPQFVDQLHSNGLHYIIILDHGIGMDPGIIERVLNGSYTAFDNGKDDNIFIMDPRNGTEILRGEVWPGLAAYPDFTLGENVTRWWKAECDHFHSSSGWRVEYDALWIDMNEPSNFRQGSTTGCTNNAWNNPPFVPNVLGAKETNGSLYDKTICMDAKQHWGLHYNVHSLFGHSMAITSYKALRELFPDRRPLVLTRSNFAGTQRYAAHWLGDNQSEWPNMAWSITGMMEYSLFGFSFTGADICGFWLATTEEMCIRWMELGAFYPFARNHNAKDFRDQDPASFGEPMISIAKDVLATRYKLLPHLYTLLYEAHRFGSTVVRPMLNEFSADPSTWAIDKQFLWGRGLLISPALEQHTRTVYAYFPAARWYDYYDGSLFESKGEYRNLSTPLEKINVHVRGGTIVPWQQPALTTTQSRNNSMGLIVALDDNFSADGTLFWDDGESFDTVTNKDFWLIKFECDSKSLTMTVEQRSTYSDAEGLVFKTVDIWSLGRRLENVLVDGEVLDEINIKYDGATKNTQFINLSLNITEPHLITWQFQP